MTARNAGQRLGRADDRQWGTAQAAPAGRYVNGRLVRPAGFVDEDGMYYIIPQSRGWPVLRAIALGIILAAGVVFALQILAGMPQATNVYPLGTADVVTRPTSDVPRPTPPPPQSNPAPRQEAPAAAFDSLPTVERPEPAEQPAPAAAPILIVTATPGITTAFQAGATQAEEAALEQFDASFEEAPCPKGMITFLKGHRCYSGPPPQAILPSPGEDGFAESFE